MGVRCTKPTHTSEHTLLPDIVLRALPMIIIRGHPSSIKMGHRGWIQIQVVFRIYYYCLWCALESNAQLVIWYSNKIMVTGSMLIYKAISWVCSKVVLVVRKKISRLPYRIFSLETKVSRLNEIPRWDPSTYNTVVYTHGSILLGPCHAHISFVTSYWNSVSCIRTVLSSPWGWRLFLWWNLFLALQDERIFNIDIFISIGIRNSLRVSVKVNRMENKIKVK